MLLSAFGGGSLQGGSDSDDADVNKIQEAIDRIVRFFKMIKNFIRNKICCCLFRKKNKKIVDTFTSVTVNSISGTNLIKNANEEISMQGFLIK